MTKERKFEAGFNIKSTNKELSRRKFIHLSSLAMGGGVMAGALGSIPSRAPASEGITRGGRLILGTPQTIQTLDPHAFGIFNNRNAWPSLYNSLVWYDADMNPLPDLAKSWEVSPDGRTYTFELHKGVLFHNGREMTADDVKFSIKRILDPKTPAGNYAASIKVIEEVKVVDKHTVELQLSKSSAVLIPGLARVMIVAKENVEEIASKAIGTGPYKLKEYIVDDRVVLDRFDDYWEGVPYMDGVTIQTRADVASLFNDLTTGAVDIYWQLEPKFVGQLVRYDTLEASFAKASGVVTYLMVDQMAEPFQDIRARQALLHACDKETMNQLAFYGTGVIPKGNNIFPRGHAFENPNLAEIPYDLDKAKKLFEAAGVSELRYVALSIVPWTIVCGEVLERSLNEIGVKLTIENPELSGWLAAFDPRVAPNTIVPNAQLPDSDPELVLSMTDNEVNPWGFDNDEVERLRVEGAAELNLEKRKEIYWRIQEIWHNEAVVPMICHDRWFHGKNRRVQNMFHINSGDIDYRWAWLKA